MRKHLTTLFIYSAGAILFLTATAKIMSAGGSARALNLADPILMLSNRHVLLIVGVVELAIAGVALFGKNRFLQLALVAWLSSNFLIYRIGLWWMGYKKPCGCLGTITDALGISPKDLESIMKGTLAFLLVGSFVCLLWHWRQRKETPPNSSLPQEPVAT